MTAVLRLPRPLRRATVTLPAEATGSRPIVAPIAVATVLGAGDPAAPIPAPVGNPFGTLHR